ncbi:MAG: DUF3426 domain-containing protein [Acidobacteriales bacterium]|nr:DUF3426 domain-containing protein [Terriglobales bacterium]
MSRLIGILLAILAVVLIAAASIKPSKLTPAASPQKAVQSLFESVKNRGWKRAYEFVSPSSNIDQPTFYRDLNGRDGSLRTYSSLQQFESKVLRESEQEAMVRAHLTWSTAVGAFYESRDLKVVKEGGSWKVLWTTEKQPNVPPQVIPVNYLRWDIIRRGADEDWGAQNVEAPRVRILSMNPLERDGNIIIMGEVVNEDTVPAFISVTATLIGKDGSPMAEESSFDKTSHTLLPKEVSPFRIDFPKVKLDKIKSVRMQPTALLVPASADPVIGVLRQRIEKDANGRTVLRGELINQSGQTVNIPHVLATFYDDSGKVIWVSDGYVDKALLPQTPLPFAVEVRDDLAPQIQNYRVTVNHYSLDRS